MPSFTLENAQIHVWHALVDDRPTDALLNDEERATAARFHFAADRLRFSFGRAMLRALLASYRSVPASRIAFEVSPSGKPRLADSELQFNLSHSQEMVVCAFAPRRRVGVDVEWVRELRDADGIVERYFSPAEIVAYRGLPTEARPRGFFNAWTRKEAFVKALGAGLGYTLSEFTVSLAPGEAGELLAVPADQMAAGWTLCDLAIDARYAAAVVAEGGAFEVLCRSWPR